VILRNAHSGRYIRGYCAMRIWESTCSDIAQCASEKVHEWYCAMRIWEGTCNGIAQCASGKVHVVILRNAHLGRLNLYCAMRI
jgi:hypothetical protein